MSEDKYKVTHKVLKSRYDSTDNKLAISLGVSLNVKAVIASEMVNRWGMVAAMPSGEDSAGRSKLRMLTEGELVDRACDTVEKLFKEFDNRGWITKNPTLDEIHPDRKE
jgi:hypothetical protein